MLSFFAIRSINFEEASVGIPVLFVLKLLFELFNLFKLLTLFFELYLFFPLPNELFKI